MAQPPNNTTLVKKGKRPRPFRPTANMDTVIYNVHELAYWCQWRLAISGACAGFDAAGEAETDAWSREWRDEISVASQAKLCSEVRHLEAQLGRLTSVNAKLEAALLEKEEDLIKLEKSSVAARAAVGRLQAHLAREKQASAASNSTFEDQLSRAETTHHGLEARLREAQNAKQATEDFSAKLVQTCSSLEGDLEKARQRTADLTAESQAGRASANAAKLDLAALREKYSALKRRMADAGRKVESVRAERDGLRQDRAALEDKLADVEKFQLSERGRALDRMEQELAEEKMTRVELEADRDDLQTQLAAALQASAQT